MKQLAKIVCLIFLSTNLFAQATGNARKAGNIHYEAGNSNYNSYNKTTTKMPQNVLPNATLYSGVVDLQVDVLSNQKADVYVAIFNLTQMAKTAEETNQLLMDRYNGFVQELQGVGVPKGDIYLDMLSFVPLYEYEKEKKIFSKTHNEVPKGFEMQQNVHVKYVDPKMMSNIMTVAAKYEIYDLVKVDYSVDNQEAIYVEMREKAVEHLVKEIELYVEKMGVDLESGYRVIAEDKKIAFPVSRYSSYNAFANVSLGGAPEKGKVRDMYKPTTLYYDKVGYENFDIVINPTVVEPAIQFMYNMKIRVVLKDTNKPAKQHFWLTPDGDIVPVEMK